MFADPWDSHCPSLFLLQYYYLKLPFLLFVCFWFLLLEYKPLKDYFSLYLEYGKQIIFWLSEFNKFHALAFLLMQRGSQALIHRCALLLYISSREKHVNFFGFGWVNWTNQIHWERWGLSSVFYNVIAWTWPEKAKVWSQRTSSWWLCVISASAIVINKS